MFNYNTTGVYKTRTVEGYIFISNTTEALTSRIFVISKVDPNAKAMLILYKTTPKEVEKLLISTWKKHNILNIFVFYMQENLTTDNFKVYGALYNPFIVKNNVRGFVYHFELGTNMSVDHIFQLENRLQNVHKYPLRICIFEHPGTVMPIYDKNGNITKYALRDGEVMHYLVSGVNFEPIYFAPTDGLLYGNAHENGTFTGALQELHTGNAEILANMRAIMKIGELDAQFTHSIVQLEFGFVSPKLGASDKILFIHIFDLSAALYLTFSYLAITCIWRLMQNLHSYFLSIKNNVSLLQFLQRLFGLMLLIGQENPNFIFERFVFASMLLFSMINTYTYQAKMVEHLTANQVSLDVDTMEELAESGMTLYTSFGMKELIEDIGKDEESPKYFKTLVKNQVIEDDYLKAVELVIETKNAVYLSGLYFSERLAAIYYSNKTGEDLLHVMSDAPPSR